MTKRPDANDLPVALAAQVREATRKGRLLGLKEVWQGTQDEFRAWLKSHTDTAIEDIELVHEQGEAYCYSKLYMSESYARLAARALCKDVCRAVAETVRSDSQKYPRPTPLAVFSQPPFALGRDQIEGAVEEIFQDPRYADIRQVQCSDGSVFLFSSAYLDPEHAASLAEWFAVGHLQNP